MIIQPTTYPIEERERARRMYRMLAGDPNARPEPLEGLIVKTKRAGEIGIALTDEEEEIVAALTKTSDMAQRANVLQALADDIRDRHLSKLLPLAQTEFAAFCEYVNPDEPPESKWHQYLTNTLQDIEYNPRRHRIILNCPPGHAKDVTLDTPIYTPNGWTTMEDIKIGDLLYDDHGKICHVTWKSPVYRNQKVYRVTTDCGDEIVCGAGHEWPVVLDRKPPRPATVRGRYKKKNPYPYTIKTAEQLAKRRAKRPMIIRAPLLEAPDVDLPLDPWLLGVWLGDGSTRSGCITAHQDDQVWLAPAIRELGYEVRNDLSDPLKVSVIGLRTKLREIGVLGNKHIPAQYIQASPAQRLALLQGLIDTDGTVSPDGQVIFCQKNRDLAEEVQFLARSLGVKATIIEGDAKLVDEFGLAWDYGRYWRVSFYMKDAARMPRKRELCRDGERTNNTYIEVIEAGYADTQCIEVSSDSHLFLIGRSMTPTHNPLDVNTPILMGNGSWKRLGDVRPGDEVVAHTGKPRKVSAVHEQGQRPMLKITTTAGRVINSALDHPFLVWGSRWTPEGKEVWEDWRAAENLRPGDKLRLVHRPSQAHPATLGSAVDAQFAAVAQAQGAMSWMTGRKHGSAYRSFYVYAPTEVMANRFDKLMNDLGVKHTCKPLRDDAGYVLRMTTADANALSAKFRLDDRRENRRVPDFIMSGTELEKKKYLSEFFSLSGEVPLRYDGRWLYVYSHNEDFLADIQKLLGWFDIDAVLDNWTRKRDKRARLIVRDGALTKFLERIPYTGKYADRIKTEAESATADSDEIRLVELSTPAECRCLTVEKDHTFIANGVVVHNSTYASRLFVAWRLGRDQDQRIIGAGHSQTFVENEFSKNIRDLVGSQSYKMVFPTLVISQHTRGANQWKLAGKRGQYVARGVGQAVHGFRSTFVLVDDPYPSIEVAESSVQRAKVNTWFTTDIGSRVLPGGKVFVIMTRFHEDDLTGYLMRMNDKLPIHDRWELIEAPAICYDEDRDIMSRRLGEVLWDFYDLSFFRTKKAELTYPRFALIYQQLADAASEGSIAGHFKYYNTLPHLTPEVMRAAIEKGEVDQETGKPIIDRKAFFRRVVVSVDTAAKATERADYTVIQVWGETHDRKYYLFAQRRVKVEFNKMIEEIERLARRWSVDAILVEDKGQGTAYIQARGETDAQRRVAPAQVIGINPGTQSKEFRFDEVCPLIEAGDVYIPEDGDFLDDFIREVGQFPDGNHDDQVDAMSQFLRWAKNTRTRFGSRKITSMG